MRFFLLSYCLFCALSFGYAQENQTVQAVVKIVPTTTQERQMGAHPNKFVFESFPPNKAIDIYRTKVFKKGSTGTFEFAETISFDEDQIINIQNKKSRVYAFDNNGICDGERATYRFQLKDGTVLAETSYIPFPIHIRSHKDTFSITAEILCWIPITNYLIVFEGLSEGEVLKISSKSGNETMQFDFIYKASNPFCYSPNISNQKGGISTLIIERNNGDRLVVNLRWGLSCIEKLLSPKRK